jgi:hypothetical protein
VGDWRKSTDTSWKKSSGRAESDERLAEGAEAVHAISFSLRSNCSMRHAQELLILPGR